MVLSLPSIASLIAIPLVLGALARGPRWRCTPVWLLALAVLLHGICTLDPVIRRATVTWPALPCRLALAADVALLAALALLCRRRALCARVDDLIDTAIAAIGVWLLTWELLFRSRLPGSVLLATGVLYAVLLAALTLAVRLLSATSSRPTSARLLVAAAVAGLVEILGRSAGSPADLPSVAALHAAADGAVPLLIAAAVVVPSLRDLVTCADEPRPGSNDRLSFSRLALLAFGLLVGPVVVVLMPHEGESANSEVLLPIVMILLAVLVLVRIVRLTRGRRQAIEALAARARQQSAAAQLGITALNGLPLPTQMNESAKVVTRILGVDACTVLQLDPDTAALRVVGGTDGPSGTVGYATSTAGDSLARFTLRSGCPIVLADTRAERRFDATRLLRNEGVVSGLAVMMLQAGGRPYGVLCATSRTHRHFTDDDVVFLQLVANVLAGAVERTASELAARHQALHDTLTGLPNRSLLLDRLEHAFRRADRGGGHVAALFIDLDDFKAVNDSCGHKVGDAVLRGVAERLRSGMRPTDTVARLAGDEFVVVCEESDALTAAHTIADRVALALAEPLPVADKFITVSASIGIAVDQDAPDPDALLHNADAAMYQAKRAGKGRSAVFNPEVHREDLYRLRLRESLRGADERGELSIVGQPIVDLRSGRVTAVETLLRWHHPQLGDVPPADFIRAAELSGTIGPLGRWALREACAAAAVWQQAEPRDPVTVYVNVSGRQLADRDFADVTQEVLTGSGVDPTRIGFEIPEGALLPDVDGALDVLRKLKRLGLRLAMDDFGSGYSCLSSLTRLPVDVLKVDRSLVRGLAGDDGDEAVVAAVIRIAAALGIEVTAAGVEAADQLSWLNRMGCDSAQGYLFAPPLPVADVTRLLRGGVTIPVGVGPSALPRLN